MPALPFTSGYGKTYPEQKKQSNKKTDKRIGSVYMSEKKVQRDILAETGGGLPGVRLFRNNVGVGFVGQIAESGPFRLVLECWRRVAFGLFKGSGDLIGWKSIVITPEMIGRRVAVFLSIENKAETGGKISEDQNRWIRVVRHFGGIAGVARSVEEARKIVENEI
jgi:hypothetical protein